MSRLMELPKEVIARITSGLDSRDLSSLSRSLPELGWLRPDTISYYIPRRNLLRRRRNVFIMRRMELSLPIVEVRVVIAWRRTHIDNFRLRVILTTMFEDGSRELTELTAPEEDTDSEVVLRVGNRREVRDIVMTGWAGELLWELGWWCQEVEVTVVASLDPLRVVRSSIPRLARQLGGRAYFGVL